MTGSTPASGRAPDAARSGDGPAPLSLGEALADSLELLPVRDRQVLHRGIVWDVVRETVDLGAAGEVTREFVDHPGAVSVAALDEDDRIVLIQQYRHPVSTLEWEIPAGLLDVPGEPPWECAVRELREEADLVATQWGVLIDYYSSPGGLNEAMRVFLARGLAAVPHHERHDRHGEELGMPVRWVLLDEARDAVLRGDIHNATAVIAILAAHTAREERWSTLRPHDAPWPQHPAYR